MKTRSLVTLLTAALLVATTVAPAAAQEEKLRGLDRAREASMKAADHANGRAAEARGEVPAGLAKDKAKDAKEDKLTGRDRAAASVARALERGNGNGNAHGRGNAADVLAKVMAGASPATLEGEANHGAKVSAMVKAFNELKKQQRSNES